MKILNKKHLLIGLLLLSTLVISSPNHQLSTSSSEINIPSLQPLTTQQLQDVISDGVTWFINDQELSGHFKYEYMPFLDRYTDDDNIVRQTGALYVLGEIYKNDRENKYDIEETIRAAIEYFKENSTTAEFHGQSFKCILKKPNNCTLGGTSLALIGIIDLVNKNVKMQFQYETLISEYAEFIKAMKIPGKGFHDSYNVANEQAASESPFGNGEAFLALTKYYQYSKDESVKEILDQAFSYFVDVYSENWDNNFYLWGMAAIKDLNRLEQKEEYFDFVKAYTDQRISLFTVKRYSNHNYCAYIEGITSAYSVMEDNLSEVEKASYLEEINFWLTKTKELQVQAKDVLKTRYNRNMFINLKLKQVTKAVGGFLTDLNEPLQRIDFTQHCLSSYMQKLVDIDQGNL